MKRSMMIAAMLIASTVAVKAQTAPAPSSNRPHMTVKVIDSIQIAGVPVNRLVIRNVTLTDSVATVSSALIYVGTTPTARGGQFTFIDNLPITNTTNLSITSIAGQIAALRGVNMH